MQKCIIFYLLWKLAYVYIINGNKSQEQYRNKEQYIFKGPKMLYPLSLINTFISIYELNKGISIDLERVRK